MSERRIECEVGILRAEVARYREALEHYASDSVWEDDTPPEEVNTAGYIVFTYVADRPGWEVARAALREQS